ncbi:MAG: hypothetical protein J5883_09070 [Clostridiales bacterium]|nr:hypothetical protein [Clostridiales bacterium]
MSPMTIKKTTVITKKGTNNISRIFAIINCAGMGDELLADNGEFVPLEKMLKTFQDFANVLFIPGVSLMGIIVADKKDIYPIRKFVKNNNIIFVDEKRIVMGGKDRIESTAKGLEELDHMPFPPTKQDIILIHSGAYYNVDKETLINCFNKSVTCEVCAAAIMEEPSSVPAPAAAVQDNVPSEPQRPAGRPGGASRYVRPIDTGFAPGSAAPALKRSVITSATPKITKNVSEVCYPQCFRYEIIMNSYVKAISGNITEDDDVSLSARIGKRALYAESTPSNTKAIK